MNTFYSEKKEKDKSVASATNKVQGCLDVAMAMTAISTDRITFM